MAASLKPHHLGRYKDLGALLLAHGRGAWKANRGVDFDEDAAREDAERLACALEEMGPTFVKLGQLLSTRVDLLPPAYTDALARLQDDVEPFSFADVERIVTDELGVRISKAFGYLDHEPLAAASLGQVHRGELRDGRPVAVKVQRPGVRQQVVADMEVIEELASFVDEHTRAGRRYGFAGMAEQFRRSLMAELDYRREASNLRTLADDLAGYDRIVVPRPIDDFTTSVVLTMEYVAGRNVGSLGPLAQLEIDGDALAEQLFRAYLDQVLVHGFFHADPHPGNVLLTDDGRLALVDVGMVATVSSSMQDGLVRLLLALSDGRADETADALSSLGEATPDFDMELFRSRIVELVELNRAATVGDLSAGRLVGELMQISGECGLRPPAELTMLGKALLNLDEVARVLAPDFDPNAVLRDHSGDILRRRMLASASPAKVAAAAMDAVEFAEKLPSRVNKVMDALAEGELTLNIEGIDEAELMRGIQKLANRVTTGVVVAALIMGGALVSRIDTGTQVFGYPVLSMVMFAIAAVAGAWLVATTLRHDLPQHRRRRV